MVSALLTARLALVLTALLHIICHIIVGVCLKLFTPYDLEFIIGFLGAVDFFVGSFMYLAVPFITPVPAPVTPEGSKVS